MNDHIKTMLIGLFVVVACGILIGMVLFFEPTVGDGKQTLLVRFSNINGINVGTRVSLAGKAIGEVVTIEQIPDARQQPTDELGQIYFYQLILHIDSKAKIYTTDEVTVQTSGLLGEKSIAIIPKAPPKGVVAQLATAKEPIYAESADPFELALNELSTLADSMEDTLHKASHWIDDNGKELGSAIRSFDDAMSEVSTAVQKANDIHLVQNFDTATQNFSKTMSDIDVAIQQMSEENTFTNAGVMIQNLKDASKSIDEIAANVADGRGTLGRIVQDDELYLRINAMISKIDTVLNDVNQYGLLFNNNKQWQRTRVKRASLLTSLESPGEFKAFFEREIDLINTAMERLSMMITMAQQKEEASRVFESETFRKDFAELMRDVDALKGNLELYNEQLMEAQ